MSPKNYWSAVDFCDANGATIIQSPIDGGCQNTDGCCRTVNNSCVSPEWWEYFTIKNAAHKDVWSAKDQSTGRKIGICGANICGFSMNDWNTDNIFAVCKK